MSFSAMVKDELAKQQGGARHCQIAELAAIINICGEILYHKKTKQPMIRIHTENKAVARKYFTLLKKTFNIKVDVINNEPASIKKNQVYIITITTPEQVERVLSATKLPYKEGLDIGAHPLIIQGLCCKRAYLRGAFMASGSMSDPEKTYHLEFVDRHLSHCELLQRMLLEFEIEAKIIQRKKYHVLYLKEGKQIVELLNVMEAHVALMELENLRILKEMRNHVNRMVNCETANLSKTITAAVDQVEAIQYIEDTEGLESLPQPLEVLARLRLELQDATLKELGERLEPPIGKSGINHRLRKISQIAEQIRNKREDFHD